MEKKDAVVFIVDDDADVRKALRRQIESAGYTVEVFESALSFINRPVSDVPSCLILDVKMPGISGTELQEHLVAVARDLPIIFLSGHADVPMTVKAMKRGAADFLQKPADDLALLGAIESALERSRQSIARKTELADAKSKFDRLTPREMEVFRKVITGALNKQIADDLGVVEQTIKFHRSAMMQKLGVDSVPDLIRLAHRAGLS